MPRIFDNIDEYLSQALQHSLSKATRADFCVGYFNLRGWKEIDVQIENFEGTEGKQCRLLVGMALSDEAELRRGLPHGQGSAGGWFGGLTVNDQSFNI